MKISDPILVSLGLLLSLAICPSALYANTPPVLTPPADMTVAESATADQTITATDADFDPVTFSLTSGPTYITVTTTTPGAGTGTGNIHLAPSLPDAGTASAVVSVSDGIDTGAPMTMTVTVDTPDLSKSYFVPESMVGGVVTQDAAAIANARRCPNDDGGQVLKNNARLKIMMIGAPSGTAMVGIPAQNICVLFNDSIIANSTYNPLWNCPDVRCVQADAPTDASGIAYITWLGSTPGSPGVATRDPLRKWGGYAGDIPVMVLGVQLQGKLSETGIQNVLGNYTAHVKSLDCVGGRTTLLNQGELVNSLDINPVQAASVPGVPYKYNLDFTNDGIVNPVDLNFIKAHLNHRCNFPIGN
jgi:hypothetical protein